MSGAGSQRLQAVWRAKGPLRRTVRATGSGLSTPSASYHCGRASWDGDVGPTLTESKVKEVLSGAGIHLASRIDTERTLGNGPSVSPPLLLVL